MSYKTHLTTGLLLWLFACFTSVANDATPRPAADPARRCVMCHKKEPAQMHGLHATALNPHDNTAVNCTNCHVPVNPDDKPHPGNRKNITSYAPLFSGPNAIASAPTEQSEASDAEAASAAEQPLPAAVQQGQLCMNCHSQETMRESFWPHDVHAAQLSCTDCHKLHPEKDPVIGLTDAQKVTLCLDCHASSPQKPEVTP